MSNTQTQPSLKTIYVAKVNKLMVCSEVIHCLPPEAKAVSKVLLSPARLNRLILGWNLKGYDVDVTNVDFYDWDVKAVSE